MRILALCPKCMELNARRATLHLVGAEPPRGHTARPTKWQPAEVYDDHLHLVCDAGHESALPPGALPHEILFEIGCHSLLDGYNREAVLGFAACFERYLEFACRLLLSARGLQRLALSDPLSRQATDAWWKLVRKQSERQLGSYVALWALAFGESPPQLGDKAIGLRNRCAHQGYIPTRGEAVEHGGHVLDTVVAATRNLQRGFAGEEVEFLLFVNDFVFPELKSSSQASALLETNALSERYYHRIDKDPDQDPDPGILEEEARAGSPAERLEHALARVAARRDLFWSRGP